MQQRVTPYLLYEDGEAAIEWLERAFGFRTLDRTIGGAGGLHASLEVHSDGSYISSVSRPATTGTLTARGVTVGVYVRVDDLDAHYERAKAAGADIFEEPVDTPFGERRYSCRDAEGHEWYFATRAEP